MARNATSPSGNAATEAGLSASRCPICRKPAVREFKPFCSRRCADVDLNRWFSGAYAIPVVEDEGSSEDEEGGEPRR